tara:strand:+ start:25 stop:972 length:948 start_codon:yes stop_codon:yes gene_type:complete
MARYSTPITQYLDDAGNPLVGGKITFLASGTENLQNTYNTEALTIANTNPVILDGAGRAGNVWMQDLDYKIRLYTSDDVLVWEADPYTSTSIRSGFDLWSSTVTYNLNSIIEGSDNNFYISIAADNLNNDPTTTPTYWTEFDVQRAWNPNEIYSIGNVARVADGVLYRSLTNSNLNNNPVGDQVNWDLAGSLTPVSGYFLSSSVGGAVVPITGVGFKPRYIQFAAEGVHTVGGVTWGASSTGYFDGTVNRCIATDTSSAGAHLVTNHTTVCWDGYYGGPADLASATVTALGADGFTYTNAAGTNKSMHVIWTAYG